MKWEEIFKNYAIDTLEFIKTGKDLAITQGSLYIQELIKWEIYKNSVQAISFLICFITCMYSFYFIKKAYKVKVEKDIYSDSGGHVGAMAFSIMLGTMFFCLTIDSSLDALKAYTSPRVVIMEKLQGLIK